MVDSETRVRVDRDILLKSVLDAGRGQRSDAELRLVRGNVKVSLEHAGDIDFDSPEIQRRLDRVGALDKAYAEGFLAGLFMGTTVALEEMMFPDLASLYPEAGANIDADELVEELKEQADHDDPSYTVVLDIEDAIEYIKDNNTFECGSVIEAGNDVVGDVYVYAPRKDAENVDTPHGWSATNDSAGISFVRDE
jgi:hypothetical protein